MMLRVTGPAAASDAAADAPEAVEGAAADGWLATLAGAFDAGAVPHAVANSNVAITTMNDLLGIIHLACGRVPGSVS